MAIDPNNPQVPRVSDAATYHDELFGVAPTEGAPSFYEFLETQRGIPRETFSPATWEFIALTNEMVAFNMVVRSIVDRRRLAEEMERRRVAKDEQLGGMSLADLMMTRNAMATQLEQVDTVIAAAAAQQAEKS